MGGGRVAMTVAPIIAMVVAVAVLQSAEAITYKVGGNDHDGWTVPTSSSFYSSWASGYTFIVNDVLEFSFIAEKHTVAEVSQSDYENCVTASPKTIWTTSPATVTLNSTGSHYFICTVGKHCDNGQKVSIHVSTSTTAPTPPPSSASFIVPAAATSVVVLGLAYVVGLL